MKTFLPSIHPIASQAPNVEMLESRIAPATIVVTTTNDTSDAQHDTGSLRDALALADANPANHDTIVFHIPAVQKVAGVFTITVNGELTSKGNVTIQGPGTDLLVLSGGGGNRILDITDGSATTDSPVTITGLSMVNAKASGNIGTGTFAQENYGGALYSAESLTLQNIIISGSTATSGGAVAIFGNATALTKAKISGALIAYNSANDYGGGLKVSRLTALSINKSTLLGNSAAADSGGAICANMNATSTGMSVTGCQISGNSASYGGGLYVEDTNGAAKSKITISGTIISGNTSSNTQADGGGGLFIASGNTVITGSSIIGNNAVYNGGGIYAKRFSSLTISNSVISGNRTLDTTQGNGGGGLHLNGEAGASLLPVKITGSQINDNQNEATGTYGGGLLATGGIALTISSSNFSGNETQASGGAIATTGTGASLVNLTVTGGSFSDNFADQSAGGIFAVGTGAVSISKAKVTGNIASTHSGGGLVLNDVPSFHISGGSFSDNNAGGNAGGIYLYNSSGSILGVTVSGNAAAEIGGGVVNTGSNAIGNVTLQVGKVFGNTAVIDPNTAGPFTFV